MRAGSIALVVTGLLASTSAVGIVFLSSQNEVGSNEVVPEVGAHVEVNAGDIATLETFSDPPLATLQYDEDLLNVIQAFDPAHGRLRVPVSDLVWPTMKPLSVDMGLTHVQLSAVTSTSATSPGYTNPSFAGTRSSAFSMRSGGASAGIPGKNFNPGGKVTDEVDEPRSPDEREPYIPPVSPPDVPSGEGDDLKKLPDVSPPVFIDPALNPPVTTVPEPGTLGLLAMGMAALLFARRKPRAPNMQ